MGKKPAELATKSQREAVIGDRFQIRGRRFESSGRFEYITAYKKIHKYYLENKLKNLIYDLID